MTAPATGLYADRLPKRHDALTDAIAEMNRTPGTLSDEQQARALHRILAAKGLRIVEAR